MKIFYCINSQTVESDINSFTTYPLSSYSKLEILHGVGSCHIVLIFNYWEQKILVIEGGILAFLYNTLGGINDLKFKKCEVAHVFSIEQGYSFKMQLINNLVVISAFNNEYVVEIQTFESALNHTSIRALKEIEFLYPEIIQNKFFKDIKSHLKIE